MRATVPGRRTLVVGCAASLMIATAGCGASHELPRNGAPPTVFCGQTIASSAAGATVTNATQPGAVTVREETVGGVVLQVSNQCKVGATVEVEPADAMQRGAQATTSDGKLAAIVLKPVATTADVSVVHQDGTSTIVHVRLTSVGS